MKRVLEIPDLHYPKNIGLESLYEFVSDWQPTHLIWGGDSMHLEIIGHWDHQEILKKKGLEEVRKTLKKESVGFREIAKKIISLCRCLSEHVYIVGNHEEWIHKYEALYGNAVGAMTLESLINPAEIGLTKIVPLGHYYKLGHLTYIHGENYSGGKLEAVAAKILNDYNTNVIFNHFHGICEVSKNSPVFQHEKRFAKCVGTMGTTNPEYAKQKPNQHQNAFHIAYIQDNGMFNDYTVRVFNGKFVAPNGKLYK